MSMSQKQPPCKDVSVEVTKQIRKPSYSYRDQVILFYQDAQWPVNLPP